MRSSRRTTMTSERTTPTKSLPQSPVGSPRKKGSGLGHVLTLRFGPNARLTDEVFEALAAENPDLRLERTARGDLEIMAPAGADSSSRNSELTYQLVRWSKHEGRGLGVPFDSSLGSILPNTAIRGPDAAWITQARWDVLSAERRQKFLGFCPDFVAELRSPSDRPPRLRKKMREYITQGARLGWLIDPLTGKVEIYRPGQPVEALERPSTLSREDVLPGFVLDLGPILAG
jgi:Uma2 family endonuclease